MNVKENVFYWVSCQRERRCAQARSEEFERKVVRKPDMDMRMKPLANKSKGRGVQVSPPLSMKPCSDGAVANKYRRRSSENPHY